MPIGDIRLGARTRFQRQPLTQPSPGPIHALHVLSGARALTMPHYNTGLTIDRDRWHDTRRGVEPLWHSWCKSPIWKSIRRHRLAEEPRCRQCTIEGRTVAANYVDHINPHLGQWLLFFKYENTQSLCAYHHNMHKQPAKRGNPTKKPADRSVGAWPRA